METLKIAQKIIRENAFEHKKKKPGLSANRPSNNSAQAINPSNETNVSQSADVSQAHEVASNKSSLYDPDSAQSLSEPKKEQASFLNKQFRWQMSYGQVYEILDNYIT